MKTSQVPIEKLIPDSRSARTHSDQQVAQVAAGIQEFGWTNPILIRPNGALIAGHARLLAARRLGLSEVPVIKLRGLNVSVMYFRNVGTGVAGIRQHSAAIPKKNPLTKVSSVTRSPIALRRRRMS